MSLAQNAQTVVITSTLDTSLNIVAYMPQEFVFGTQATWESLSPFAGSLSDFSQGAGPLLGTLTRGMQAVTGFNAVTDLLSNRVWVGTTPITFSLLLLFDAHEDAEKDVYDKLMELQNLSLSRRGSETERSNSGGIFGLVKDVAADALGSLLFPPAWDKDGVNSNGRKGKSAIVIRIGNLFMFDDVVLENVQVSMQSRLTKEGWPIHGTAEIQLSTRNFVALEDMERYRLGGQRGELPAWQEDSALTSAEQAAQTPTAVPDENANQGPAPGTAIQGQAGDVNRR